MIKVTLRVKLSCTWASYLKGLGVNVTILQCVPRQSGEGISALVRVSSSSQNSPSSISSCLSGFPTIKRASFVSSGSGEMLGLVVTKRCACAKTVLPRYNLLSANSEGRWIRWRLLLDSNKSLKELLKELELSGIDYSVESVERAKGILGLTPKQEEFLRVALELGYYDVPRKVSLKEIASLFGISARAASEVIRRAEKKAVMSALNRVTA